MPGQFLVLAFRWMASILLALAVLTVAGSPCAVAQEEEQQEPEPKQAGNPEENQESDVPVSKNGDSGDVQALSFDDIKFEMEKNEPWSMDLLTEAILELKGKRISLRGYILPTTKTSGITTFILVRDNQECCFGPGAALYDCVLVKLAEDHAVDFTVRPVKVEGEFMIKEFKVGGQVMAIYRMKNAIVSQ